jgi:hypothetical protein
MIMSIAPAHRQFGMKATAPLNFAELATGVQVPAVLS